MSSFLVEIVTRCISCGWCFRHSNVAGQVHRLRCRACESKQ